MPPRILCQFRTVDQEIDPFVAWKWFKNHKFSCGTTPEAMLANKEAAAAAGELKTSSITRSFIHRDVSQSWLKKTSIDCTGWLSLNNSSPDSTRKPFQCLHQPLKTTCKGAALNNCGSKLKVKLSRRDASLTPGDISPNFTLPSFMESTISTSSLDQSKPHCSIPVCNSSSEKLPMAEKMAEMPKVQVDV